MRRAIALFMALALMVTSLGSVAAQAPSQDPVDPVEGCDYHEETGHNLCEPFQAYWNANGGLMVFGRPLTEAFEEENIDTGETYLVQYFERERMEYHEALAGTEYEILLGRLGNEVLLQQGRNWLDFEKSDPSEENYIAETGFAVPQMFLDYWASEGLDLGDEGISFRESLALFGYPISQAEMETNADGDTVLTQWFERARFEHHPDNDPQFQVLLGRLGAEVLAGAEPPPDPEVMLTTITTDVSQPRHLSIGGDGAIYVANAGMGGEDCHVLQPPEENGENGENGEATLEQNGEDELALCFGATGSISRIADGEVTTLVDGIPSVLAGMESSGIHDVVVTEEGDVYGVMGWGFGLTTEMRASFGEIAEYFGHLVKFEEDGSVTSIADLLQYETDENPDDGIIDSNPYSLVWHDEHFAVIDAGGNTLLHVTMEGEVTTVATFPVREGQVPGAPEGVMAPVESVPTHVVVGPDGAYYVGELTGGPFPIGGANVWRVSEEGEVTEYATGFTMIGAIGFDSEGSLHVLEMVSGSLALANPEDPSTVASTLIKVHEDGSHETIASGADGLLFATGMAITAEDEIYVANAGTIPPMSAIVRVDPYVAPEE